MNEKRTGDQDRRRDVCRACIGGLAVCSVGTVGFPVVSFLGFPQRLATTKPLEVPLAALATGQAQYADLGGRQIIVLARSRGPLVVNAACTHLGCNVIWEASDSVFRCPCHGAIFDDDGQVVSGPVNQPLQTIAWEIKDETLVVQ